MKTFARTLLMLLLLLLFAENAPAAVLERVTGESLANGRDVISILFEGGSVAKVFALNDDSEPRLVFDFPDARYLGPAEIAIDGTIVKAVRVAMHQNPLKTRVVFDLNPAHDVGYEQEFLEDSQILRISLFDKKKAPAAQPLAPEQAGTPAPLTESSAPPPAESPASPSAKSSAPPPTKPVESAAAADKPVETAPSPFGDPFLTDELLYGPTGPRTPDEIASSLVASSGAVRLLDYSLSTQATGSDVLRLKLDGRASPKIITREGEKPQLVCFFPRMILATGKKTSHAVLGKFVENVTVSAQAAPAGVQVVLELEAGHDYSIQQIFVEDELAFWLIVNASP